MFRQQRLTKPSSDQRVLRFDDRFDMLIDTKSLYVLRQEAFETLFVDREAWKARVPAQVDLLVESGLPIKNLPELVEACQGNLNMMRKLQRIAEGGYLEQLSIGKIEALVKEFKLDPGVISEGKLYFDPKNRWEILRVLDDDYLRSGMTDRRYEVNSKVKIT